MKRARLYLLLPLLVPASASAALLPELPGGRLEANGQALPLVASDAEITITGDVASVELRQRFENPSALPVSAHYRFPLPHDAAVHHLEMVVAGETVRARVERIEAAKQAFEAAKSAGKSAALLTEQRANVFTQSVANIPAGDVVEIRIRYAQTVPREDGVYRLHFPMAVAARYRNGAHGVEVPGLSNAPPAPGPTPTASGGSSVRVRLEAGQRIESVESPSHAIEVDVLGAGRREVLLAAGRVPDDRDFVLAYRLDRAALSAGIIESFDARGRFATLLVDPPAERPTDAPDRARELVFVLDASCSMNGAPLEAGKALIQRALADLDAQDSFRVIVFGSSASELMKAPVPATRDNVQAAQRRVAAFGPQGGTEIELGLRAALSPPVREGVLRQVVFVTDGLIGDEASVIATLHQLRGEARLFSFGVGRSPNRYLLEEMAVAGGGVARVVDAEAPGEVEAAVAALTQRLGSPYLTDAWVDWGDCGVTGVSPASTFDLYPGEPVRVLARLPDRGCQGQRAWLVAEAAGRPVRLPLLVRSLDRPSEGIAVLWARAQVAEKMRALTRPWALRGEAAERQQLIEEITELGLGFGISTRWTAFVAVSERVTAPEVVAESAPVFSGSSTPEPSTWALMLMLALMAMAQLRRQARSA